MKPIKVGDEMRLTNMNGYLNGIKVTIETDCIEGVFEVKLLEAPTNTPWRIGDVIAVEQLELKEP